MTHLYDSSYDSSDRTKTKKKTEDSPDLELE